jgi:hypothetical protein
VVVLVEKDSLADYTAKLAAIFGFTYLVSGGTSKLIETEFLVRALQPLDEVEVIAHVDFDPEGWTLADAFVDQLRRYGMKVSGTLPHLVRGECFTAEELELYSFPCSCASPAEVTLARRWVERGGGINGQPVGIHANHLKPIERVQAELERLL